MKLRISNFKKGLIIITLYFLFSFFSFFPTIIKTFPDLGDSIHNSWVMYNTAHQLTTCGIKCMYESNTYFPIKNSGTFAETLIAESTIFYPIFKISGNPQLAFNITVLACFFLTYLSCYLIFHLISRDVLLSVLLSTCFNYLPFRIAHIPHIQLISMYLIVFPIFFLIRYYRYKRNLDLFLLFSSFIYKTISFGYNTFILYMFLGIWFLINIVLMIKSRKIEKHAIGVMVGILMISLLNLLVFYVPYINSAKDGKVRTLWEVNFYGADLSYFVSSPSTNIVYGKLTAPIRKIDINGEVSTLFIGMSPILLMTILIGFCKRNLKTKLNSEGYMLIFTSLVVVGICISLILGPNIKFNGREIGQNLPFLILWKVGVGKFTRYVPAFIQVIVFCVYLAIVVLSKNQEKNKIWKKLLIVLIIIAFYEYRFNLSPIVWDYNKSNIPPVYQYLIESKDKLSMVELPIQTGYSPAAEYFNLQMEYLYFSIFHGRNMLNGQSGFFPDEFVMNSAMAFKFPSKDSIDYLKRIGINEVVVHPKYYLDDLGGKVIKLSKQNSNLKEIYVDNITGDRVYILD